MENIDPGLFIFMAVCNPGVKAEDVEKEILGEIKKLKTEKRLKKKTAAYVKTRKTWKNKSDKAVSIELKKQEQFEAILNNDQG